MASTTGYCLVCGTPTRVVLPESTPPLMSYGGEGAPRLAVPADSVVLCKEHTRTDVVAFLADQLKAARAVEKEASDAADARVKAQEDEEKAAAKAKADEEKAAKQAAADAEAAAEKAAADAEKAAKDAEKEARAEARAEAKAEAAPPAPARRGRSS